MDPHLGALAARAPTSRVTVSHMILPRRRPPIGPLAAALSFLAACGQSPPQATVSGEQAYAVKCGSRHDPPNGIGAALTPAVLASYSTTGGLDGYLRVAMPHQDPGGLSAAEYEAILVYLIESRELVPGADDVLKLPDSTKLSGGPAR